MFFKIIYFVIFFWSQTPVLIFDFIFRSSRIEVKDGKTLYMMLFYKLYTSYSKTMQHVLLK